MMNFSKLMLRKNAKVKGKNYSNEIKNKAFKKE